MKTRLMASAAVVALAAIPVGLNQLAQGEFGIATAYAQHQGGGAGGGGGHGGGGHGGGGGGHGGGGHDLDAAGAGADTTHDHTDGDTHDHEDGSEHGSSGKGRGGSGGDHADGEDHTAEDHDHTDGSDHGGKGGSAGHAGRGGGEQDFNADDTRQGGRPAWAQEGIPEVELGRLNVSRAPTHVLDQALGEALSSWNGDTADWYSMTAPEAAAYLLAHPDLVRIDSPLQNLALYKEVVTDGTTELSGVTPASREDLAAIFLGAASDKTMPVTDDTVVALNAILGLPAMTEAQVDQVQAGAEAVREAIYTVHEM